MDAKKDAINKIADKLENIDDTKIIAAIKNYINIKDYQNELNLNSNIGFYSNIEFYPKGYATKVNLQKVGDNIFLRYENLNRITIGPFNLTSTSDYALNKKNKYRFWKTIKQGKRTIWRDSDRKTSQHKRMNLRKESV